MIIRAGTATLQVATPEHAAKSGRYSSARLSEDGGISQYGAYIETLDPGARSSERHWHEKEDEFLYVLSGEAVLIENDGEHILKPGDAACWPAGVPNAHHLINRSSQPCSFLIVGTRLTHDTCHYPDIGHTLYTEGENWRIEGKDGTVLKSGKV